MRPTLTHEVRPVVAPDAASDAASSSPTEPSAAPTSTLATRVRQRLFQPWSQRGAAAAAPSLPAPVARRHLGFQASIAEFLLVTRLRARRRAAPSADVLERAARIVFVTCQNWFGTDDSRSADARHHHHHQTRI